jgi:hypothetical protein
MPDEFTTEEKLREIEREIAIRERVVVSVGKVSAARAQKQIDILRAIARDLRKEQSK